jgi:hypothetical protein
MNKFLYLIIFIAFSCSKETDCLEITRKEKSGSNFLFFWNDNNNGFFNDNNVVDENGLIPSGAVTEEIYNKHEVGDTYCVD